MWFSLLNVKRRAGLRIGFDHVTAPDEDAPPNQYVGFSIGAAPDENAAPHEDLRLN